jgi:hypothetical protein
MTKKALTLTLEDTDCIELVRILLDEDEQAALAFMKQHFMGKTRELLGVSPEVFLDKKCGLHRRNPGVNGRFFLS